MASGGSVYSQTLRSITQTKLDELAKKRATFEEQRGQAVTQSEAEDDDLSSIGILTDGVKRCFSISTSQGRVVQRTSNNPRLEIDLKNLDRFLAQARYDPSVTSTILNQWRQTLLRHLEVQSLKFEYASLYGKLTNEWLLAKQSAKQEAPATIGDDVEMDDFEQVSRGKKLESRFKWEQSAFQHVEVDRTALSGLLHGLFESTPDDSKHLLKALEALREQVEEFERELASPGRFDDKSLDWTIRSLLNSDLLNNGKREVLRDFLGNETILGEVADVLNMRMSAVGDWSWGEEIILEERRQLNGTYNIYMQEDLMEAIFLQYIGIRWSVFWKEALHSFQRTPGVWKSSQSSIPLLDRKRRGFYLGSVASHDSVVSERLSIYRNGYFVSQLLDNESQEIINEDGEEEAKMEAIQEESYLAPQSKKRARFRPQSASKAARKWPSSDSPDYEIMEDESGRHKPKNAMEAKQNLLHLLSAEILMQTWLHGELTCFRTQIDSLYPSLPHSTINCVMAFFGVSDHWLRFFKRFLQAPLRFVDGQSTEPRQRMNGAPGSHVLSEVFGEVTLFCVDFQINQETDGELLWRRNDDLWFWSSNHASCEKVWKILKQFGTSTGLKLNDPRSGAVRIARESAGSKQLRSLDVGRVLPHGQIRWGMLYLDAESGRFTIDQSMVDKHIGELSRQLSSKTDNIFAWIQAWNSYAATFFTSNFGKPANCFGRQHVDDMLATHEKIQRQLFSSARNITGAESGTGKGSVVEYLQHLIKQRFGVDDIPDGYFYFPTELGGLEVRNPFIGLLQVRDAVCENPNQLFDEFAEAEVEAYQSAREAFENDRVAKPSGDDYRPEDPDRFFPFEEYTKYREELDYRLSNKFLHGLKSVLTTLLTKQEEESIEIANYGSIKSALNSLYTQPGLRGILSNWHSMEPYWKWVAQLYGSGMIDKFGGLSIVDPGLLPMGMVSLFRSGRVNWQE